MISKVYENKYGLIKWNCITSDLEVAKTDSIYLADKATGSLIINIQEPSNSLIWDNENKEWIPYAVNGGGGGTGTSEKGNWITNTTVGNLKAGTDVTGWTPLKMWEKATKSYELPKATINYNPSTPVLLELGTSFNLAITASAIKKGDNLISKLELYKNNTLAEVKTYADETSINFTTISGINSNTSFKVRIYDVTDKYVDLGAKTYEFVNATYCGVLDNIPNETSIPTLTKLIRKKAEYVGTYNAVNQYIVFAYPSEYGDLTSILDQNGFENITDYTKINLTINTVEYAVYYTTGKKTLTNFKYTFK